MIKPLTSLRFFFAFFVFLHHLIFIIDQDNNSFLDIYYKYLEEGFIGVGFFFILSGFILTHVYQLAINKANLNLNHFYIKRIARIYPLHLLTLILSIPLTLSLLQKSSIEWASKFVEQIFLVQSFIPIRSHYFSFNMVSWSISTEMFFYLMFPFLSKFILKLNHQKIYLLLISIFIGVFCSMSLVPEKYHHFLFYINPLSRLADFALGIALYKTTQSLSFKTYSKATLWEIISIILLIVFYSLSSFIPEVYCLSIYYWLPISILIIVFSKNSGWFSIVLSKRVFVVLGEISYGFYLLHFLVIKYAVAINNKYEIIASDIALSICVLMASLLVSFVSYYSYETILNLKIKKLFIRSHKE